MHCLIPQLAHCTLMTLLPTMWTGSHYWFFHLLPFFLRFFCLNIKYASLFSLSQSVTEFLKNLLLDRHTACGSLSFFSFFLRSSSAFCRIFTQKLYIHFKVPSIKANSDHPQIHLRSFQTRRKTSASCKYTNAIILSMMISKMIPTTFQMSGNFSIKVVVINFMPTAHRLIGLSRNIPSASNVKSTPFRT